MMDTNSIILGLLAFETIRSLIAATGIFKWDTPVLGRIIYGKYDETLLGEVFRQLGYGQQQKDSIIKKIKKISQEDNQYPDKDTPLKLIHILSKYTIEFESDISYGMISPNKSLSYSKYYINTMEAVHDLGDIKVLSHILIRLLCKKVENEDIDFIIVPKGGNPMLAQNIASELGVSLIVAKDINDSARPRESDELDKIYKIKYEGLDLLLRKNAQKKKLRGIIIDCNTSGGTQLLTIVRDFNEIIKSCEFPIKRIKNCFVLFRLIKFDKKTNKEDNIDKKFSDEKCQLHRFFDLDEDDKRNLANVQFDEYYEALNSGRLEDVLCSLKRKSKYYYE